MLWQLALLSQRTCDMEFTCGGQVRRLAAQHAAAFQIVHLHCSAAIAGCRNSARPTLTRVPSEVFLRLVKVRLFYLGGLMLSLEWVQQKPLHCDSDMTVAAC